MARPRIERLIDKFGNFALIISKYIYGIRAAMCLFYGIGRMRYTRFLFLDVISCIIWVFRTGERRIFFQRRDFDNYRRFQTNRRRAFLCRFNRNYYFLRRRALLSVGKSRRCKTGNDS
jgi:hypothetical protein